VEKFSRKLRTGAHTFVITAAQNATPVHAAAWASLLTLAKHRRAELLVIPYTYKNPTSQWTEQQEDHNWWSEEVLPFLWNVKHQLCGDLTLLANIPVQPTAGDPLGGLDSVSNESSSIVGHAKIQLRSVAAPASGRAKIMTTTGACTIANYTASKAGWLGEFHHTIAAVIVEIDGPAFFLRHVNWDKKTGSFTDLGTRYFPDRHEAAPRPAALIMGDTHVDFVDASVEKGTFGPEGIVETLDPRTLVWHDLLDAYACNPHHRGKPFVAVAKAMTGRDRVREEIERAAQYIRRYTTGDRKSVVVASNHDNFLSRWISDTDWRSDPVNSETYLETALFMRRNVRIDIEVGTVYPDPFTQYWIPKLIDTRGIKLLKKDESFSLAGVELGMHGDVGPNGSRGSAKNLRRIGVRSIIGHSHTANIEEGCYQVGTSAYLKPEYCSGPSTRSQCHALLHDNGKRQLIFFNGHKWRGRVR
jgi:hypothetical protein